LTDNPICTCSGDHKIVVFGGDGPVKSWKLRTCYFESNRCLKLYPSHMKIVWSSTGSGGGDPYRMVRIPCESGVLIKILESELGNLNPYSSTLLFSALRRSRSPPNPELYAFRVLMNFWRVRIWGSRFTSYSGSFRKF
jgi:hypothetical protein